MENKVYDANATDKPLSTLLNQFVDPSATPDDQNCEFAEVDELPSAPSIVNQNLTINIVQDETQAAVDAVVSVIEEYNVKFGVQLPTKIDDIKAIIHGIASKADRDMYVVALSEIADRVTLATVTSLLITITTLTEQLSSQAFLNTLTVAERVAILREFLDYIMKLNDIRKELNVGNPTIEMKNAVKSAKQGDAQGKTVDSSKIDQILEILNGKK